MRGRLIGHRIGTHPAPQQLRHDLRRVSEHRHRHRDLRALRFVDDGEGFVERVSAPIEVTRLQALFDPRGIALDGEHRRAGHRRGERLRAAHAAQARGENPLAAEIAAVVLAAELGKRLVRSLHDALRADVDPRAGRHLAVHHQPFAVELVKVLPRRPVRDEVRVGDHDARRIGVRAEHADGLAGLDRERLVVAQALQLGDDPVERGPVARGLADPAVDHEIVRPFGDLGIEVVHQHPQRGFGLPVAGAQRAPARRADRARELVDQSGALRRDTPGRDGAAPVPSAAPVCRPVLAKIALKRYCCTLIQPESSVGALDAFCARPASTSRSSAPNAARLGRFSARRAGHEAAA